MKTDRKGGIILKVLALLALVLMIIAVQVPQGMWADQAQREALAHKRMLDMNECEVAYYQENGQYEKDLKKVYEYIATHNMAVGAPEIESEILAVDTTSYRITFSDYKHAKDLSVTRTDKQELVRMPGSIARPTDTLYYCGNEINVTLAFKDAKLDLRADILTLTSQDSIMAVANYKNATDIAWDFNSKSKITLKRSKIYTFQPGKDLNPVLAYLAGKNIEVIKSADGQNQIVYLNENQINEFSAAFDPTAFLQESQSINMARYLLSDVDTDNEPYLCPSTKENFKVSYNLSGKFYMKIRFFKEGTANGEKITANEKVKNYFLNIVKLKAERKTNDFIREKDVEGDSSYSKSAEKKKALFAKNFNEFLATGLKDGAISDSVSNILTATDDTQEQDFSDDKKEAILLNANPGEEAIAEAAKAENAALLDKIVYTRSIGTDKIDITSLKIASPITEQSTFRGYTRSFLQSRSLFGVADDKNHGFVDNGRASWKKE